MKYDLFHMFTGGPLWDISWKSGKVSFPPYWGSGRKWQKVSTWKNGREFRRNNKKICDLKKRYTKEEQEEIDYWNKLLG